MRGDDDLFAIMEEMTGVLLLQLQPNHRFKNQPPPSQKNETIRTQQQQQHQQSFVMRTMDHPHSVYGIPASLPKLPSSRLQPQS